MGRKKSDKPKAPKAPKKSAEDLNDDDLATLTYQHKGRYETTLAAKKKADAEFKNACKRARSELGDEAIDDIKQLIEIEDDEEAAKSKYSTRVQRIMRVAKMAGMTLAVQLDMFGGKNSKHYEDGKRSALKGEPRTPPKHLSVSGAEYQDWLRGHADGNAARNADLAKAAESGDDDEDERRPEGMPRDEWHAKLREQAAAADAAAKH
jgi:hypothetical protein